MITISKSLILSVFLFASSVLFADGPYRESIKLAIDNPDHIASLKNVEIATGKLNKKSIRLSDSVYVMDDRTDLLMHFDGGSDSFDPGSYQFNPNSFTLNTQVKKFGGSSASFTGSKIGSVLTADKEAIFYPGAQLRDFTIEFWLYAPDYSSGQSVIEWKGAAWLGKELIPQLFEVHIQNRHLVWSFSKVFMDLSPNVAGAMSRTLDLSLTNKTELVPKTWYHHSLRYEAKTGKLLYSLNDKPQEIVYATASGKPENQKFTGYIGERSTGTIEIGRNLRGNLDEIRIYRAWVNQFKLVPSTMAGEVIFAPLDFRQIGAGAKIVQIDVPLDTPGQTEVRFKYAMLQTLFPPADLARGGAIDWLPLGKDMKISEKNSGLWLLVKADLYPDGTGENKPSLQDLTIYYTPDPPPPPPGGLKIVKTGDGEISLSWNAVPVPDIQGYILYYGEKPGQYFGENALGESSPIKLGNVLSFTLKGLENNKVYYFMIASYDRSNDPSLGLDLRRGTSKEVSARPAP